MKKITQETRILEDVQEKRSQRKLNSNRTKNSKNNTKSPQKVHNFIESINFI